MVEAADPETVVEPAGIVTEVALEACCYYYCP